MEKKQNQQQTKNPDQEKFGGTPKNIAEVKQAVNRHSETCNPKICISTAAQLVKYTPNS